jgi:hypothetical protein
MDFTVYSQDGSHGGREDQHVGDDTVKVGVPACWKWPPVDGHL